MKNINQKTSNTDKQITLALLRAVWLSYLLPLGSISTGALLIFSVAVNLGTKPAQANLSERAASFPDRTVQDESAQSASTDSIAQQSPADSSQALGTGEPVQTAEGDIQQTADSPNRQAPSELADTQGLDDSVELTATQAEASDIATASFSEAAPLSPATQAKAEQERSLLSNSCQKEDAASNCPDATCADAPNATTNTRDEQAAPTPTPQRVANRCTSQLEQAEFAPTQGAIAQIPDSSPPRQDAVKAFQNSSSTEFTVAPSALDKKPRPQGFGVFGNGEWGMGNGEIATNYPSPITTTASVDSSSPTRAEVSSPIPNETQPKSDTAVSAVPIANSLSFAQPSPTTDKRNVLAQIPPGTEPPPAAQASPPASTATEPAPYHGPGGAALLGGTLQAQSSGKDDLESTKDTQNAAQLQNPLAPSLVFQGGFITQGGDTGARARVTGIYPISPNALFGGTVDLSTGKGFSDTDGTGLDLNELYFTGSLPSYPNLRLTAGLMDLTSYFDRNSFAKDSLTHFFNPVFQTNPALAAAGIASRPGVLLNWDISDNVQARAAAFSSHKNIGDFALDAYAAELAFRYGNAIVRGTFASDRDAGKNSGFEEIYGIPRGNNEFGIRPGDRENAYGINAEYYIPDIKMGLFGRYGHYENTAIGKGGDTFSLGLNFLDLFMKDDRLGFGYGRNLSNNDLRRDLGNKVPDVWEVFYDFRVTPYLRAGVSLQARDEFSDVVAGFRVKTEFDLLGSGRLFR